MAESQQFVYAYQQDIKSELSDFDFYASLVLGNTLFPAIMPVKRTNFDSPAIKTVYSVLFFSLATSSRINLPPRSETITERKQFFLQEYDYVLPSQQTTRTFLRLSNYLNTLKNEGFMVEQSDRYRQRGYDLLVRWMQMFATYAPRDKINRQSNLIRLVITNYVSNVFTFDREHRDSVLQMVMAKLSEPYTLDPVLGILVDEDTKKMLAFLRASMNRSDEFLNHYATLLFRPSNHEEHCPAMLIASEPFQGSRDTLTYNTGKTGWIKIALQAGDHVVAGDQSLFNRESKNAKSKSSKHTESIEECTKDTGQYVLCFDDFVLASVVSKPTKQSTVKNVLSCADLAGEGLRLIATTNLNFRDDQSHDDNLHNIKVLRKSVREIGGKCSDSDLPAIMSRFKIYTTKRIHDSKLIRNQSQVNSHGRLTFAWFLKRLYHEQIIKRDTLYLDDEPTLIQKLRERDDSAFRPETNPMRLPGVGKNISMRQMPSPPESVASLARFTQQNDPPSPTGSAPSSISSSQLNDDDDNSVNTLIHFALPRCPAAISCNAQRQELPMFTETSTVDFFPVIQSSLYQTGASTQTGQSSCAMFNQQPLQTDVYWEPHAYDISHDFNLPGPSYANNSLPPFANDNFHHFPTSSSQLEQCTAVTQKFS